MIGISNGIIRKRYTTCKAVINKNKERDENDDTDEEESDIDNDDEMFEEVEKGH